MKICPDKAVTQTELPVGTHIEVGFWVGSKGGLEKSKLSRIDVTETEFQLV